VQFIDGDCELDAGWIARAARFLEGHSDVAVVCGRRRERHPEASVYNRLCDLEWDTPIGETDACGGDSLMRVVAFDQVDGFRESIIAGEEPDLCFRMRERGWKVHRIDAEMTLHDAAMTRFSQWWLRNKRSGHATAEAWHRRGSLRDRKDLKDLVSNVAWSLPAAWPLWPVLWMRVYQRRRDPAYATFIVLGKLPHAQGQLKFWADRLRGRGGRLIEYK
jgi:GT2 family glycosyltransferase